MSAPFLSVRGLSVAYGDRCVLDGVDLDLAAGGRLAIIGESGSGKSTLALAIAGLLPDEARIGGRIDFATPPVLGRDIGVVFQDPGSSLDPVMRVGEQVAETIRAHRGLGRREARERAVELLDQVRIPDAAARADGYPHEFSGGQKQRIAMAAALAAGPTLLIADEPTSALDTIVQRELVRLIDELVRARAMTLVFVTHDIALASELASEVAVLHRGRLVEAGPAAEVFARPRHAYTRALLETRLDLDTPLRARLPEIDPADLSVRIPAVRP